MVGVKQTTNAELKPSQVWVQKYRAHLRKKKGKRRQRRSLVSTAVIVRGEKEGEQKEKTKQSEIRKRKISHDLNHNQGFQQVQRNRRTMVPDIKGNTRLRRLNQKLPDQGWELSSERQKHLFKEMGTTARLQESKY